MTSQHFTNVWDAIEDTPAEAETMRLRSQILRDLQNYIAENRLTHAQAAKLFGVTQPRIADLSRGKINLFSLDTLISMSACAGLHIDMQILVPS